MALWRGEANGTTRVVGFLGIAFRPGPTRSVRHRRAGPGAQDVDKQGRTLLRLGYCSVQPGGAVDDGPQADRELARVDRRRYSGGRRLLGERPPAYRGPVRGVPGARGAGVLAVAEGDARCGSRSTLTTP